MATEKNVHIDAICSFLFFNGRHPFFVFCFFALTYYPGALRKSYLNQLCNPQRQSSWLTPNGSVWRRRWHKAGLPAPLPQRVGGSGGGCVCVGKVFFFPPLLLFSFFLCTPNTLQGPIQLPPKRWWHPLELFHCHWLNLMLSNLIIWFESGQNSWIASSLCESAPESENLGILRNALHCFFFFFFLDHTDPNWTPNCFLKNYRNENWQPPS